jgi:hypothetical protein
MEAEPNGALDLSAGSNSYYAFIPAPRAQTQFSFPAAPTREREGKMIGDLADRSERIWPG